MAENIPEGNKGQMPEIFQHLLKARQFDVKPTRSDWYYLVSPHYGIHDKRGYYNIEEDDWLYTDHCEGWLEPITPEQFLIEHPELVEKIFEVAKRKVAKTIDGITMDYPMTAQDYIDSLKNILKNGTEVQK